MEFFSKPDLEIYRPDGRRFMSSVELEQRAENALSELQREHQRYDELVRRLQERGIDPDAV